MQTGVREARLLEEKLGIHTLSEKRQAKLDIMAPIISQHSASGDVLRLADEVFIAVEYRLLLFSPCVL